MRAGRFGAYVNWGKVNATIPKATTPDSITLTDALELIAEREGKPAATSPRRSAKTASAKAKPQPTKPAAADSAKARAKPASPHRPAAKRAATKPSKEPLAAPKKPAAKKR